MPCLPQMVGLWHWVARTITYRKWIKLAIFHGCMVGWSMGQKQTENKNVILKKTENITSINQIQICDCKRDTNRRRKKGHVLEHAPYLDGPLPQAQWHGCNAGTFNSYVNLPEGNPNWIKGDDFYKWDGMGCQILRQPHVHLSMRPSKTAKTPEEPDRQHFLVKAYS